MTAIGRIARTAAVALGALGLLAPVASAQSEECLGPVGGGTTPVAGGAPLTFGIYPGGLAGQIGPPAPPKPDDPPAIVRALSDLRGDARRPFNVHLYLEFTGAADQEQRVRQALELIERYGSRGYDVEYVLTYRPRARRGALDVIDWVAFVRSMVRRLGAAPGLAGLQITNEVTNTVSPDASDGAYPGARDALVQGVLAADDEARRSGRPDLAIGFNWFYRLDPATEQGFWTEIGVKGGPAFARAVDWIGLDAYPGTFFPPGGGTSLRGSMINAMAVLRECYAPMAGIGPEKPMHVIENGWPTGPGRPAATQAAALDEMVRAVHDHRRTYNVTSYNWFDLRDGDSSSQNFGQHYGIMLDDYTPKPAFAVYRGLIEQLGVRPVDAGGGPAGPATGRRRARLAVTVRPRRARRARPVVRTRGRLVLPGGVDAARACGGRVTVQVKARRRTVSARRARVRPNCTFASRVALRVPSRLRGARRLAVHVRFAGNARLRPATARPRAVRLRAQRARSADAGPGGPASASR